MREGLAESERILEQKVIERTEEVVRQRHIVEEKHKEITAINLILIYWMLTSSNYLESIFISVILGGALGNFIFIFFN